MNTKALLFTILASGSVVAGRAETPNQFKDDLEKSSYAAGLFYGTDWKRREMEFNLDALVRGIKDAQGGKPLLTEAEMSETLKKFSADMFAKQQEKRKLLGEKNKKDGEEFLAANKTKPGVVTLPSGLQYKVVAEGAGDMPKPTDKVTVEYRGTLIDGTEFDNSRKPNNPPGGVTFGVTQVVPGWTEALTKMKVGAKWQLFIPAELAYKEFGKPPVIAPNAVLLFDVELVSIQPPPPPPAPAAPLTSDIIKVPSLEEMKKGAKIETIKAEDVDKLQKQQPPPKP